MAKEHNAAPILELMNEWYSPEIIAKAIDDVLFYYAVKRLEEGNVYKGDAEIVNLLKDLRDAFSKA